MRILTLTLKNFRSHHETVLELDRFNFIRGPNGCGKSSIQMALEYLFTGRCELTDAAGRGAEALIRAGAKELEVSATLEDGETICRRRTPRSHIVEINRRRVPVDAAKTFIAKRFGSADVLSVVLNTGRFIGMSEAERKRLLAQVADAGGADISQEIFDTLRSTDGAPPRPTCPADVEAIQSQLHDLRTEVNSVLRTLGHLEKPGLPSALPLKQQSKSEQFRLGIAFQIAVAAVTGIRFTVIDSADILDKERRKMLTRLLLTSELDQAIVLATSEEAPPSTVPDGVKFLDLGEGLKPSEAVLSQSL